MSSETEGIDNTNECFEKSQENGEASLKTKHGLDYLSMSKDDKDNIVKCLKEEPESREAAQETKDDVDSFSINGEDSLSQILSNTCLQIPHSSPRALSDEQHQISEISIDEDLELPRPGAHQFPGIGTVERDSNAMINAISNNTTGVTIDDAYLADESFETISKNGKASLKTKEDLECLSMSAEDKHNVTECLKEKPESRETSLRARAYVENEGYSDGQIMSETHIDIRTDGPPASSHEQRQTIERDPHESVMVSSNDVSELMESSDDDSELPIRGAYHIPGMGTTADRNSNAIINAISYNMTGVTITDAYLADDATNAILNDKRSFRTFYLILIIIPALASIAAVSIIYLPAPPSTAKTTKNEKNETVKNNQSHDETEATIDDLKNIIIESNISSIDDLMNSSSPQSKALFWMTDESITMFLLEGMMVESLIQRYVSVVLYYSLNGEKWSNRFSFLTKGISECLWGDNSIHIYFNDGITCNQNGTISRILLSQNNLSGTIHSEVGHLSSLMHFNLMDNNIGGTIPSSIARIDTLHSLSLSFNRITGTVPTSLSNITNIGKFFNFYSNIFSHVQFLERLGLANPNLSGLEEFCPLIEGKGIFLETYCNESQHLEKDECNKHERHQCCQFVKDDVFQCCPSNPSSARVKCYDPILTIFLFD